MQWPDEQQCNNMPCVVNCGFCNPRTTQKRGESFGISKIGNKIKGVFKSSAMEGAMLPNYNLNEGEDDFVSKAIKFYMKSLLRWGFLFSFAHLTMLHFCCLHCTVFMCWLLTKLPYLPYIHSQAKVPSPRSTWCASELFAVVQRTTKSSSVRYICKQ